MPRNALGFFPAGPAVVPPGEGCFSQVGFDEGNAEQYVWYVPQNIAGLVTALGGRQAVADRLDKFTTKLNVGPTEPYLWAGNEPSFAIPWLYNYIGQPCKTQELVDRVRSTLFSPTPERRAGQRRPGRDVGLVRVGGARPVPQRAVHADADGEYAAVRPGRDRASRRQIHPDHRARRVRTSPHAVHQRPAHRRLVDRQNVSSVVSYSGWRRAGVLALGEAQQVLGDRVIVGAAVVRCGLSVAGFVIEADGTEAEAIAALLHDAAEDQGGEETLAEIREKFGDEIAAIVGECSDTFETPKPPWRERKQRYIDHLPEASDGAILVSLADKLHNAHAILRDFRAHGSELWQRFNVKDPQQHMWYYRSLLDVYSKRVDNWMVDELREVIDALEREVGRSA